MKNKFFTPGKLSRFCVALIWLGTIVALFANPINRPLLWVGPAIAVVGLILCFTIVRCPVCGEKSK